MKDTRPVGCPGCAWKVCADYDAEQWLCDMADPPRPLAFQEVIPEWCPKKEVGVPSNVTISKAEIKKLRENLEAPAYGEVKEADMVRWEKQFDEDQPLDRLVRRLIAALRDARA